MEQLPNGPEVVSLLELFCIFITFVITDHPFYRPNQLTVSVTLDIYVLSLMQQPEGEDRFSVIERSGCVCVQGVGGGGASVIFVDICIIQFIICLLPVIPQVYLSAPQAQEYVHVLLSVF